METNGLAKAIENGTFTVQKGYVGRTALGKFLVSCEIAPGFHATFPTQRLKKEEVGTAKVWKAKPTAVDLTETTKMLKTAIDDVTKMFMLTAAESKFNKDDVLAAAQRLVYKIKMQQHFDALEVQAHQTGDTLDDPIIIESDDDNSTSNDEYSSYDGRDDLASLFDDEVVDEATGDNA
ncbi:hypothetical protein FQN52_005987 [Onygenales sp. PD_12]|nr:hypothetical protein FQN52_005987 [Onygenales sp. PD_12]